MVHPRTIAISPAHPHLYPLSTRLPVPQADWSERTEFVLESAFNQRDETELQAMTRKRYEMAQRMGQAERTAFYQNVPKLPFTNSALAASIGKTVEDFETPPSIAQCNVVFDALVQSKSSLIPPDVCEQRRLAWMSSDGLDVGGFRLGLYKACDAAQLSLSFLPRRPRRPSPPSPPLTCAWPSLAGSLPRGSLVVPLRQGTDPRRSGRPQGARRHHQPRREGAGALSGLDPPLRVHRRCGLRGDIAAVVVVGEY